MKDTADPMYPSSPGKTGGFRSYIGAGVPRANYNRIAPGGVDGSNSIETFGGDNDIDAELTRGQDVSDHPTAPAGIGGNRSIREKRTGTGNEGRDDAY